MTTDVSVQPQAQSQPIPGWLRAGLFLIVVVILGALLYGVFSGRLKLLENLSKTETARGLVTFLMTFGIISLAFVLVLSVFLSSDPAAVQKFDKAQELFSKLLVVLASIIGFYFGVQVGEREAELEQTPATINTTAIPDSGNESGVTSP